MCASMIPMVIVHTLTSCKVQNTAGRILSPNGGLDEQPTIHEGVTAHVLEQKGIISDRCELNSVKDITSCRNTSKETVNPSIQKNLLIGSQIFRMQSFYSGQFIISTINEQIEKMTKK